MQKPPTKKTKVFADSQAQSEPAIFTGVKLVESELPVTLIYPLPSMYLDLAVSVLDCWTFGSFNKFCSQGHAYHAFEKEQPASSPISTTLIVLHPLVQSIRNGPMGQRALMGRTARTCTAKDLTSNFHPGCRNSSGLYTELADGNDFYKAHQPGESVEP